MSRIRTKTALIIITGIFFCMQFWYFSKFIGVSDFFPIPAGYGFKNIMERYPAAIEKPSLANFKSKVFQTNIEQASNDRLPAFTLIVKAYRDIARLFYRLNLQLLPRSWSPVLPIGNQIVAARDHNRLLTVGIANIPSNRNKLIEKAKYYNTIAMEYPNCRIFVMPVISAGNWLAESLSHYKGKTRVLAGERYLTELATMLDPGIYFDWIGKDLSLESRLNLYYKTDHHFTMRGGYYAYKHIIRALAIGNEMSMEPMPIDEWRTIPGVCYRGTLARKAGAYTALVDQFEVALFNSPTFSNLTPNKKQNSGIMQEYLNGQFPTDDFANHYGRYFGGDPGFIHYSYEFAPKRNLLVVSDSYDDHIEPLIAKHYRNTYFLNPVHYKRDTGKLFDINEIISKYNINDIVFFGKPRLTLGFRGL
jgi:hypothetical protein